MRAAATLSIRWATSLTNDAICLALTAAPPSPPPAVPAPSEMCTRSFFKVGLRACVRSINQTNQSIINVSSTSEEASTWRQAKAAERNTRARAWRGAGDQSRRQKTGFRLRPTDRQAFRDGCRACRSAPPSLSSLKAASGTLLSQLSPHFRPAAIIESHDRGPGEIQVCHSILPLDKSESGARDNRGVIKVQKDHPAAICP